MLGNFTARALIMLIFGANVLQSHARYSAPLLDSVEFNPYVSKRAPHGRTLGMNDRMKGS